jgi:hypothetical protein
MCDDIIGDDAESDPAPDAVLPFVECSPQPMPAFQNTNAALAVPPRFTYVDSGRVCPALV